MHSSRYSRRLAKGRTSLSTTRSLVCHCDLHKEGSYGNGVSGKMGKDSKSNQVSELDAIGQYQNSQALIRYNTCILDICVQGIP